MDILSHGLAGRRDGLVVVFYLFALIYERCHLGLAAVINENRSNLDNCLGIEIVSRIGDLYGCIDIASDRLKNCGIASHDYILSHFDHLLGRSA